MKQLFKGLSLFVAVTCVVWIAVLWHWRATSRPMDERDLLIDLVLLPIVIFALLLALRAAWRSAQARQAAAGLASAAAGGAAPPAAASTPSREASPWQLLGSWVNTAAAEDSTALLEAALEGAPRPKPDDELRDDDGLPVLSARIDALDLGALDEQVEALPKPPGHRAPTLAWRRALAALSPLLDQAVDLLLAWPQPFARQDAAGHRREPSRVRVLVGWPSGWSVEACTLAQAWLEARLGERARPTIATDGWQIQSLQQPGAELLAAAERLLDALARQQQPDPVLVLACHSDLDEQALYALVRDQRLFHAEHRPRGAMPGEGAAAFLRAPPAFAAEPPPEPPALHLWTLATARRERSADAAGRTDDPALQRAAQAALAAADLPAAAIKVLVSDAEQHSTRATELFSLSLASWPDLDPVEDLRLQGTVTGHLGSVAPLAALAGAAAAVLSQEGAPVLALSLSDPQGRLAAVLRGADPPATSD
jgi:hypothetical protein